jgi:glutathione S-transferase
MLRIWGNADSVNVQKVLWCCEELSLAYERTDAGRHFGVVRTPAFLALNPNGLVPAIDDDGFVVWESNAIVRYLSAKHAAGSLWPTDLRTRALADRWMDWANSTLWPSLVPLFRTLYRTAERERDPTAVEAARQEALVAMVILDGALQPAAYLAGDAFTMGDVAVGCAAWRWFAMPIKRPALPALQRWFDALAARPAYRRVVMQPLD